jgi:class 3 adenylate cyclase
MSNEQKTEQGHILVVDDNRMNRIKLWRVLEQQGHTVGLAENGQQALDQLRAEPFDLVLLDIVMPEMDGFQVLEYLKDDPDLRPIPVIVISAVDEMESVVRCIEMGAEDYLPKPFDPVLLRARIGASLEKKRLRDQEQAYLRQLQEEQEKSERLLLNILPQPIAERLKQERGTIADSFAEVTVLFADLVGFTALSSHMPATDLVILLNDIFSTFDCLAEQHGLEKIKTIGDAYLLVGGLPTPRPDHAAAVADMALAMRREIDRFCGAEGHPIQIRIGMHSGPVVAGVIGTSKFSYDLWGDTVNIASRMESHGIAGSIQMTSATCRLLDERYTYEERGTIAVKGRGELTTYPTGLACPRRIWYDAGRMQQQRRASLPGVPQENAPCSALSPVM